MSKPLPSREYLLECFDYDKETDTLRWKKRPAEHFDSAATFRYFNSRCAGKECGSMVGINNTQYGKYRIIFKIVHGTEPSSKVINKGYLYYNKTKPSPYEARFAKNRSIMIKCFKTEQEARDWLDEKRKEFERGYLIIKNRRGALGLKGVDYHNGKYQSKVQHNNKQYYLGMFDTAKEASNAYVKAKEEIEQGVFVPPDFKVENKTGFKGVRKDGNKYRAAIKINRKQKHLGTFNTPEEAHEAYLKAKEERNNPPKPELTGIEWLQQLANEYKDFNKTLD